jgi:hypothetical protein
MKDHKFYSYELGIAAAAGLAYLRKSSGILNIWNENLEKLTGYSESFIKCCFLDLEKKME